MINKISFNETSNLCNIFSPIKLFKSLGDLCRLIIDSLFGKKDPAPALSGRNIHQLKPKPSPAATLFAIPTPKTPQLYEEPTRTTTGNDNIWRGSIVEVNGKPVKNEEALRKALTSEQFNAFSPLLGQAGFKPITDKFVERLTSPVENPVDKLQQMPMADSFFYSISTKENTLRISCSPIHSEKPKSNPFQRAKGPNEIDPNAVTFDASITYNLTDKTCTFSHMPRNAV